MLSIYRFDRLAPYPILDSFSSLRAELTLVDSPHPALPDPARLRLHVRPVGTATKDPVVMLRLPIRTVAGSPESVRLEFLPVEPPAPAGAFTLFLEGLDASARGFRQELTTWTGGETAHLQAPANLGFILSDRSSNARESLAFPLTWHRLGLKLFRPVDVIVDLVSISVTGDARLFRSGLAEG